MLFTRLLTAIILIPLVLCGIIYLPPFYFSMIIAALILIGAWEWAGLIGFRKCECVSKCVCSVKNTVIFLKITYVGFIFIGLFFATFLILSSLQSVALVLGISVLIWIWFLVAILCYQKKELAAGFQFSTLRFFTGFIVLLTTWIAIVFLKVDPHFGPSWLILLLCIIWAADTGAYFAGRLLGKHFLSSRVSPKKTWEGFFGGILLSVIVAAIGGLFLSLPTEKYFYLLAISFITALFSVIGDLGVSLLKRISNVKDSGKFFPGHGGMLDRLDSIAAASVVFVLGVLLVGV